MIEFTCSLNVLLGMVGASSSAGIKQQAANAAVHIQRGERCLNFAAQNGRLTVLFQLEDKSERLKDVCWTDDEDRIVSICFREIIGEMEKLPKIVTVHVGLTRVDITPVGDRTTKGSYCSRWKIPLQHTLFPDMTRLPRPTVGDLRELTGMTPDLDTVNLLQKTAKRLGSGMKQPRFTFFGQHSVESIGVRYGDLPAFYAVMKALPGDAMQCDPPAWLIDSEMIPGMASLSSIFFRQLSEAEKAEQAEQAEAEPPKEKKKRGRKPKETPGQTVMEEAVAVEVVVESTRPRLLEWGSAVEEIRDGDGKTMGEIVVHEAESSWSPYRYRITESGDGFFDQSSDPELMLNSDGATVRFESLNDAKAICQGWEDTALEDFPGETACVEEALKLNKDHFLAVTPPEALPDGDGVKVVMGEETLYMSLEDFAQADNLPSFLAGMSSEHLIEFRGLAERSELVWLGEQIDLEVRRRELGKAAVNEEPVAASA